MTENYPDYMFEEAARRQLANKTFPEMTETIMTNETQLLKELQELEELEKTKTPVEKAYKLVYGGFPITDGTGNEYDELAWNAFYHGYYAGKGTDD